MPIPPQVIPAAAPRHRRRKTAPPLPATPQLVAASYDDLNVTVTLTFDRAMDFSGLVGPAVVVTDGATHERYAAEGPVWSTTATSIRVTLLYAGDAPEAAGVTLDASAGNGIVAQAGGAAWAGATGVALPYPA